MKSKKDVHMVPLSSQKKAEGHAELDRPSTRFPYGQQHDISSCKVEEGWRVPVSSPSTRQVWANQTTKQLIDNYYHHRQSRKTLVGQFSSEQTGKMGVSKWTKRITHQSDWIGWTYILKISLVNHSTNISSG